MRSSFRSRSSRSPARPRPVDPESPSAAPPTEPPPRVGFDTLGLTQGVLDSVRSMGYLLATPIQAEAIPLALAGRDVIGQAQTGSGKTAAYAIPMIERFEPEAGPIQGLVLCPTRELAVQVHDEVSLLGRGRGIRAVAIYGGESIQRQLSELKLEPHIVVATPGRLADHMQRRTISLKHVRIAVLDEADRMLDMGFAPDVERILRECPSEGRQTLLFSATVPEWIRRLAQRYMHDPVSVSMGEGPEMVAGVRQLYIQAQWAEKLNVLERIMEQPDVTMGLIFTETKRDADILQAQLQRRGHHVGVLHGDLSQRDRDHAMSEFKATNTHFLVATNVASRGLDIDDISHVINYDVPGTPDEYLHRVGRTARAGRAGVAITLITPSEILKLREVERHAHTHIEQATLADFPRSAAAASG